MPDELTKVAEDSARSGFFLISGTALSTVLLAIGSIIIARVLHDDLYGQYSLALVIPQIVFLFSDLGLSQGIVKFTAELRSKGETYRVAKIIQHGLLLKSIIGVGLFLVTYVFADLFASVILQRPELGFYVRISSLSVLFQVIFTTTTSSFVGMDKTEYAAAATNISAVAKTVIQVILVLFGFAVAGAVTGHVVSQGISGIVGIFLLLFLLRKYKSASDGQTFKGNVKILLKYGGPLYVSALLVGFIPLYQNVILAIFTTDAAVGNYRAAANFATLITVLAIPISTIMLPAFSKINGATSKKIGNFFKLANKYTAILVVPVTVLIMVLSKEIVQIVYGSTFESAPFFLTMSCLIYLLVGFGYLTLTSFYNGQGETKVTLRITLITFILIFVLSPALASILGVEGLIIAFIFASCVAQVYSSYYARRKFHVVFDTSALLKIYGVAAISSIIPFLFVSFLRLPMLIVVSLGGVLYFFSYVTLMPLTGIVNLSELHQLSRIANKVRLLGTVLKPIFAYQRKILHAKLNRAK